MLQKVTWKNVHSAPGHKEFWAPDNANLEDCPKCKYGTLRSYENSDHLYCIDCKMVYRDREDVKNFVK